jgi:hypothetical protein
MRTALMAIAARPPSAASSVPVASSGVAVTMSAGMSEG